MFKWGFANFSTQTILDNTKRDIPEVEVTLGKDAASVTLMPDGKLTALLPNDVSAENFTYDYTLETRSVEAPVEQGQKLGEMVISVGGHPGSGGHLFGGAGPLALPAGPDSEVL